MIISNAQTLLLLILVLSSFFKTLLFFCWNWHTSIYWIASHCFYTRLHAHLFTFNFIYTHTFSMGYFTKHVMHSLLIFTSLHKWSQIILLIFTSLHKWNQIILLVFTSLHKWIQTILLAFTSLHKWNKTVTSSHKWKQKHKTYLIPTVTSTNV